MTDQPWPAAGKAQDSYLLSRPDVLAGLKSDPGPLGLDTLLAEIGKPVPGSSPPVDGSS